MMNWKNRSDWIGYFSFKTDWFQYANTLSGVLNKIVRLQRDFLWGSNKSNRKLPWVRWEKICEEKNQGGLRVKDLRCFNEALLGNWRWNLFEQEDSLWVKVIKSKYGGWRRLVEGNTNYKPYIWWRDHCLVGGGGGKSSSKWFDLLVS